MRELADVEEPAATAVIKRSPWWLELGLIAGAYFLYSWISDRAPRGAAIAHGRAILSFERTLHIELEHALNHWWAARGHGVIVLGNLYYDLMHFVVPVGTLLWVYFFRHRIYVRVRTPLLLVSLIALAVFWLWPTAPPRLTPGIAIYDTIAQVHTLGGGGSHGMNAAENPFAALPSLHIGWATWSAYAVWCSTRSKVWRALLVLNVVVMAFLVMATGNHWISDVAAGASGVFVSAGLAALGRQAWTSRRRDRVSADSAETDTVVDARR